jgi:hypothetical protein
MTDEFDDQFDPFEAEEWAAEDGFDDLDSDDYLDDPYDDYDYIEEDWEDEDDAL